MLVTERPGRMRIVDARRHLVAAGRRRAAGFRRAARPACSTSRSTAASRRTARIYFCFNADAGGSVAVARAQLDAGDRPAPRRGDRHLPSAGPALAGRPQCRLPYRAGAATAICSLRSAIISDRATRRRISPTIIGKIVRIKPDGAVPPDNPFVGRSGARPEIWSYGQRNSARPRLPSGRREIVGAGARRRRAATRSTSSRRARTTAGR